mmetsp:Transcript_10257/g.9263  ORF Transcript_10257/g.9263 Transcript_10257/m.9263 type:complete len:227 (-) Transcript_10257:13-693(-)
MSNKHLTVFCLRCKHKMGCPSNAGIIQCTQCALIQDPFCEYDIKCNGCNSNLTHPISAKIIQCPLCLTFMDVTDPNLSSMDLIELSQDISSKRKNLKRKLNVNDNEKEYDLISNSNTTVTDQSISNHREKYQYGVPKKRRKIFDINDYNEQWIDYQSNKIFQFQPNRPNNNDNNNLNVKHLKVKNIEKDESELIITKSHQHKNDEKKLKNVNSKYGSFKMTSLTFI